MTHAAIAALNVEVARAKEIFASLTPAEWDAASGCDGWRVQDVVQHMAATFQKIAAPDTVDGGDSGQTETSAEVPVQQRKDWTPTEVIAAYEEWAGKGVAALAALQEAPMADTVVPLSDLGEHPLHILANAIVFDHYCHLRHDIGAAVDRAAQLPRDAAALSATVEWMFAGLPQMCAAELDAGPNQVVNLVFDGPAADTFCISPGPDGWTVANHRDDDAPVIRTTAHDFVSWGTKRTDWRGTSTGDVGNERVAAVLDAINII
jgi:uncharacterized protein (TIGR03083 family)